MVECFGCGASLAAGERYCGSCGTKNLAFSEEAFLAEQAFESSDRPRPAAVIKPESEPAAAVVGAEVGRQTGELNEKAKLKPAPAKEEVAAPAKEEVAAPAKEEVAAPKEEVAAPAKEEVAAPAKEEVVAPAKEEVAAPAKEEVAAPAKEEVVASAKEEVVASAKEEVAASAKEEVAAASASAEFTPISSASLGGSATDNVPNAGTNNVHKGSTGGRKPAIKQLDSGAVLNGRYEISRRIGGGGMGAVYLAKDRNLGDAARAVKEMVEAHLDPAMHEKAIGDFKRESLLLTSLEHPSIPTIYDYFYDEALGRFYLVMKYISGGDLASRLRSAPGGRIDEKTVTDWGMQVADVLEYLHTRPKQIIYRDLKPANLMIDGNTGRVMLIDFGIARWVKQEEKGVTAVGTMGYAPPELFAGRVEARSDVYSLGATMFHLLTGADPQDNPLLIFDFAKNPRPRQLTPSLSSEMEHILMRAVEYKAEDRFSSAGEMRDVLATHLEKLMSGRVSYGMPAPQLGSETVQVQTVYCGFCGGRIAADDVFCAHCGARQPIAGVATSASLRAARPTAKLVVAGTTELDASFILQKDNNLVGRTDPHSNIFPEIDLSRFDPETKVSRRHARIWLEGETFLVEDLGSVNGTVINDSVRLAPRQPRVLDSGDKLRLGETTLHFLLG